MKIIWKTKYFKYLDRRVSDCHILWPDGLKLCTYGETLDLKETLLLDYWVTNLRGSPSYLIIKEALLILSMYPFFTYLHLNVILYIFIDWFKVHCFEKLYSR